MDVKRFLYYLGWLSLGTWFLNFAIHFNQYTYREIISGIVFICVGVTIYFVIVSLYYKGILDGKMVVWILAFIGLCLVVLMVYFSLFHDKYLLLQ